MLSLINSTAHLSFRVSAGGHLHDRGRSFLHGRGHGVWVGHRDRSRLRRRGV